MKNTRAILDEVLREIQPDKNYEKEIFRLLNGLIKKINSNRKDIRAVLGGSGAKGTWLKAFDADIFVLFDYNKYRDKSDNLSDLLEKILKKKFKSAVRIHGSRDYFQIRQGTFTFEIIPILKIKKASQAKNITDVSPLHSEWVRKHRKLISEMKLTKQFCQAQRVYGAESYINGFSGYVCEILTVYYRSFLNLLRNAAKWQDKTVIDAGKYYRGRDVFKHINTSKLVSPLIVIDPVQNDRNAAAALSREKFEKFRHSCRRFMKKPSKEFFESVDLGSLFLSLKSDSNKIVVLKVTPLTGKIDVVGGRLLKIYGFFSNEFRKHGFNAVKSDWEWDKSNGAFFYFLFDRKKLQKNIEMEGPPLKMEGHVENFRKMHRKTLIKNGKIFALEQRRFLAPESLLSSLVKNLFVKERCKSIAHKLL